MNYATVREEIPNGDGLTISAEFSVPEGNSPRPVVFIFHGFTGYKESPDLADLSDKLAKKGIAAVRFTATGFGDSGGTVEHDYRFSRHVKDAEVIRSYVSHETFADMARSGVYGNSLGGKLAVLHAAEHPDTKALCITSAPVSFDRTMYGTLYAAWKETGYFEKVSGRDGKRIRVPYAFVGDAERPEFDPLAAVARITGARALVIAGDADTEVPWQETERIYSALRVPGEFRLIPGMEHKYKSQPAVMDRVNGEIVNFFEARL